MMLEMGSNDKGFMKTKLRIKISLNFIFTPIKDDYYIGGLIWLPIQGSRFGHLIFICFNFLIPQNVNYVYLFVFLRASLSAHFIKNFISKYW